MTPRSRRVGTGWFVRHDGRYGVLGDLEGDIGSSNYEVSVFDLTGLNSIGVWFSVSSAGAALELVARREAGRTSGRSRARGPPSPSSGAVGEFAVALPQLWGDQLTGDPAGRYIGQYRRGRPARTLP